MFARSPIFLFCIGLMSCVTPAKGQEVETVDYVDLARYMGTWYEIASFPQSFQEGCVATSATYTLKPRVNRVEVVNRCREEVLEGDERVAHGWAKVVDRETNAKLKVTFFWPFFGDYWIIGLDENYQWAVVGAPGRDYLWILSRRRQMDEGLYQEIIESVVLAQDFDPTRLRRTLQPTAGD